MNPQRFSIAPVWLLAVAVGIAGCAPLPPLDGRATTPRLEISGARLDGVEVTINDAALPDDDARP